MTGYELWQECSQHFPNVGITQFLIDYNKEYKKFSHETRLPVKQANLTVVANTVQYTLATEFSDIDGELVKEILFKDSTGELVEKTQTLKFSITNGVIRFYDFYKGIITTIPSEISTITFVYIYIPADITETTSPVFEDQFHLAPLNAVLKKYYATFPTINRQFQDGSTAQTKDLASASFWGTEYKFLELAGKRAANEYTPIHVDG
jgi:hypothetical protein